MLPYSGTVLVSFTVVVGSSTALVNKSKTALVLFSNS